MTAAASVAQNLVAAASVIALQEALAAPARPAAAVAVVVDIVLPVSSSAYTIAIGIIRDTVFDV